MSIPRFPATTPADELGQALDEAGCLVVTGVMSPGAAGRIRDELAPHMATTRVIEDDDPAEFYPGRTRRVSALVARSATITDELIAHPLSKRLCDDFLLPNGEFGYQLHVTAALEVGPGAREQVLHREDDSFSEFVEDLLGDVAAQPHRSRRPGVLVGLRERQGRDHPAVEVGPGPIDHGVGDRVGDEVVDDQRQVRPVLFDRPDRHQDDRLLADLRLDLGTREFVKATGHGRTLPNDPTRTASPGQAEVRHG